jgi:hypothetical protein
LILSNIMSIPSLFTDTSSPLNFACSSSQPVHHLALPVISSHLISSHLSLCIILHCSSSQPVHHLAHPNPHSSPTFVLCICASHTSNACIWQTASAPPKQVHMAGSPERKTDPSNLRPISPQFRPLILLHHNATLQSAHLIPSHPIHTHTTHTLQSAFCTTSIVHRRPASASRAPSEDPATRERRR